MGTEFLRLSDFSSRSVFDAATGQRASLPITPAGQRLRGNEHSHDDGQPANCDRNAEPTHLCRRMIGILNTNNRNRGPSREYRGFGQWIALRTKSVARATDMLTRTAVFNANVLEASSLRLVHVPA